MLKKSLFMTLFFAYEIFAMRPATQAAVIIRQLDTKTEKAIQEIQDIKIQNILRDFVRNPQSESVKNWLQPHGFDGLNNTELLNAISLLPVYEGVLLLSLVALDDKLDESFSQTRSLRDKARLQTDNRQFNKALTFCNAADKKLKTEVRPIFEKITSINETLDGAAAKVAHNIFSSLKKTHSKIMSEEQNIEKCTQTARSHLQDSFSHPAASPAP